MRGIGEGCESFRFEIIIKTVFAAKPADANFAFRLPRSMPMVSLLGT